MEIGNHTKRIISEKTKGMSNVFSIIVPYSRDSAVGSKLIEILVNCLSHFRISTAVIIIVRDAGLPKIFIDKMMDLSTRLFYLRSVHS